MSRKVKMTIGLSFHSKSQKKWNCSRNRNRKSLIKICKCLLRASTTNPGAGAGEVGGEFDNSPDTCIKKPFPLVFIVAEFWRSSEIEFRIVNSFFYTLQVHISADHQFPVPTINRLLCVHY